MAVARAVADYVRAAPAIATLRLGTALVAGIAPAAVAWLTKVVLDRLTADDGRSIAVPLVALALLGAAIAIAGHAVHYATGEMGRRVSARSLVRLFGAVCAPVGIAELEDPAFHDRLRLAQQAAGGGIAQLAESVVDAGQSVVALAGFLIALQTISPLTTLLVVGSAVPILAAQWRLARQQTENQAEMSPMLRRQVFYTTLMLNPRAAGEIRLFGLGDLFRGRMLSELRAAQRGQHRVDRTTLRVDAALSILTAAVSGAALLVLAARIRAGQAGVGDLAVLIAALAGVQGALATTVGRLTGLGPLRALYDDYTAVAGGPPAPAGQEPALAPLRHGIEFHDVWFRYHPDHDWVLRGVDLRIPAGESVALVGLNGAGKSTLVKLLCRLYEPDRGRITFDGVDLRDLGPQAYRRRIGVLFQDFMTYELTVTENIGVGDVAALESSAKITEAAELAGIHERIAALPAGYDTMLSRMFAGHDGAGAQLSGGQWQRLALARALLRRDADLLILDEPSSGLDAAAEREIHARLTEMRHGSASLLISHRLSAVRDANQIVVLRDGVVAERGDHDTLMGRGGDYARLFRSQADGYQLTGGGDDR
jgi:ATP-binding cassette subfamily B protein